MKARETVVDSPSNLAHIRVRSRAKTKRRIEMGILFLATFGIVALSAGGFALRQEFDISPEAPALTPIPARELKSWLDEGRPFRLIDARPITEFSVGHIPTAMPRKQAPETKPYQENAQSVPVVVYCHGPLASKWSPCFQAIVTELQAGTRHVYWLKEGAAVWRAQGYPMTEADG
jgi:rhodanese-related sulfurtransferase